MSGEALIQLALAETGYNQRQLGSQLGVSPTQVSKWKKGEHMSDAMQNRLREITGIGDEDPAFITLAGSVSNAKKWKMLIIGLPSIRSRRRSYRRLMTQSVLIIRALAMMKEINAYGIVCIIMFWVIRRDCRFRRLMSKYWTYCQLA